MGSIRECAGSSKGGSHVTIPPCRALKKTPSLSTNPTHCSCLSPLYLVFLSLRLADSSFLPVTKVFPLPSPSPRRHQLPQKKYRILRAVQRTRATCRHAVLPGQKNKVSLECSVWERGHLIITASVLGGVEVSTYESS